MLKIARYKATTSGGSATLSIKIPGTFTTLNKNDPAFVGMDLKTARIWFGSPSEGDKINVIQIKDNDGIIPVQIRSVFPNYPIVQDSTVAEMAAANQGLYLNSKGPMEFIPQGTQTLLPSGLYLCIEVEKNSALSIDTIYANILYDDRA